MKGRNMMTYMGKHLTSALLALAIASSSTAQITSAEGNTIMNATDKEDYATVINTFDTAFREGRCDFSDCGYFAVNLLYAGQYERAIQMVDKALTFKDAKYDIGARASLHSTRARANIYLGNNTAALADVESYMSAANGSLPSSYTTAAQYLYALGYTDRAINWLDQAIAAMPDSVKLYYAKADILTDIGMGQKAVDLLNGAVADSHIEKSDRVKSYIAQAYIAEGLYSKALPLAIDAWDRSLILELYDTIPTRVEWQLKAIERNGTNPTSLTTLRANLADRYGNFATCIEKSKAVKKAGGNANDWNSYIAEKYVCAHKCAEARPYVDLALSADSATGWAKRDLLIILAEQGQKDLLKAEIRKCVNSDHLFNNVAQLCRSLMRLNDRQEAEDLIPTLRKTVNASLSNDFTVLSFATLLEQFGHHDEAVTYARKAIDLVQVDNRLATCTRTMPSAGSLVDAYAIVDPSNALADSLATVLAKSKSATANELFSAASLRSVQGRTKEALALIGRALKMGSLVSSVRTNPLLSNVRKDPGFAALIAPYDKLVAVSQRETKPALVSVSYEDYRGAKRLATTVNGVDMKATINQDDKGLFIYMSHDEATFLLKNDYVSENDYLATYGLLVLKTLKIGGLSLSDVNVIVSETQKDPLIISRAFLINTFGTMTENKAAKTLTFDTSL